MDERVPNRREFRMLRRCSGLTQREASLAVGKSHSHCGLLEAGKCDTGTETFRRYMVVFKAGPFDILNCLNLNPLDKEVIKRFETRCRDEGKDPVKVVETMMRLYVVAE